MRSNENHAMKKQHCAAAIVSALEKQGVDTIFIGPPGEHVVELYDSLLDSTVIKGYLATNEYTLSFMADGYSRASGKVGVFTCVPGPGVTNALTGIAEAYTDSSPVVGIISDVRAHIEEPFQLHQIPNLEVLAPVTKKCFRIMDASQVPDIVAEAFHVAQSGEPGPVMIEVPCDIYPQRGKIPEAKRFAEPGQPDEDKIAQFADMLKEAKQCGIYVGRGCYQADREVLALSEVLQAPVASSISGRGIAPESHPLSVGFGFGRNGTKIAYETFKQCDAVLAVGCKFEEVSSGSFSFKIPRTFIHVDINPYNLNKVFKTDHVLTCDAKLFLQKLLDALKDYRRPTNTTLQEQIRRGKEEFYSGIAEGDPEGDRVDPGKFYSVLREIMSPNDTLTVDIGNHELWGISCYPVEAKGTFLCPTNFSAMGFAIPAAIAAQLNRPTQRAVCCVGDGGFLMSGFEILTAARYNLPVIFCVFNDGSLGITKGLQSRLFKRTAYVDLENPDYQSFANSFGIEYFEMKHDRDVQGALEAAWALNKPALINVHVSYEKMSPFLKGILFHRIKVTPWQEKLHYARRYLRRTLFSES